MILVCLECAADMKEIKTNVYCCPSCGWRAEQLSFEGMNPMDKTSVPKDVQEAWNIVAAFLNRQPEISFSISPWFRCGEPDERNQYTIETNDGSGRVVITAAEEWRWKSFTPAEGLRFDRNTQPIGGGRKRSYTSSNNEGE